MKGNRTEPPKPETDEGESRAEEQSMPSSRDRILERLASAYKPGTTPESLLSRVVYDVTADPEDRDEMLKLLLSRFESNSIGYHLAAGQNELLDSLANNIYSNRARQAAVEPCELFDRLGLMAGLDGRLPDVRLVAAEDQPPGDLAPAEVGVTCCVALIAQTGTVVLSARTRAALAVSLLPRIHFCVATMDMIYPDAESWLSEGGLDPEEHYVLVSGPSRTADIEKQVVIGVHGPWKLSLFMLRE